MPTKVRWRNMMDDVPLNKTSKLLRVLASEVGPLLMFFVSFMIWGIFVATAVFMVAMVVSVAVTYIEKSRLPTFPMLGAIMVLAFGGLTLWLGEATFIKIQPTVGNALFGAMILGGPLIGTNYLKRAFGDELTMRDKAWRTLALRAGIFLMALAAANEFVRMNFSTEVWVWFKVFGILPLDALFAASQWPLIRRERKAATEERERNRSKAASDEDAEAGHKSATPEAARGGAGATWAGVRALER